MKLNYQDKNVAVLGFAIEGQAMTDFLLNRNCHITVYDDKELDEEVRRKYEARGVIFHAGPFGDLTGFDVISRTPGMRLDRAEIQQASAAGVPVISNTKLFLDEAKGKVIGITGTKGKGTTAQLLYNIISSSRDNVFLGGNIGQSPLQFLSQLNDKSIAILELSSFQLADVTKSPQIAIVLMVTSEHLDYHPTSESYIDAKAGIAKFQQADDVIIFNSDYPNSVTIAKQSLGRKLAVSRKKLEGEGCFVDNGWIMMRLGQTEEKIMPVADIALVGQHNWENVCPAILAAKLIGIDNKFIIDAIKKFQGLEHRLEFVAEKRGVKYYNDSISTTPESTIAAIKSFSQPKILILGGSSKQSDFSLLAQTIKENDVRAIIGVGQEWPRIKEVLWNTTSHLIENLTTMEEIVEAARKAAKPGYVVLLSPACASFGLFKDYKDRGRQFKEAVDKL
ncbi:MAG: UDP-N-acetylmuramoyl-L-alanine--D-glutamate ligase [Candidatus Komeilibacteria bacterium]